MHSSADLADEHKLITALTDALTDGVAGQGTGVDVARIEMLVDALAACLGQLHIVKEERALFPLLQSRGVPKDHAVVAALLDQHESGRAYLRRLRSVCTWVRANRAGAVDELRTLVAEFGGLVNEHVRIEDEYFYEMAKRQLSADDEASLGRAFAALDESIGGNAIRAAARKALRDVGIPPPVDFPDA